MPERRSGRERIASAFAAAGGQGRAALMPYLMGGFPDRATANEVASAYVDAGADLIELGIPFSDPLADGPVIHAAATDALAAGATLKGALGTCSAVGGEVPVVVMAYVNMVLAHGTEEFADLLARSAAAGAIIPDLPYEEADAIREPFQAAGLALVPLVAPTTPPERRRRICERAQGFVYVVSDTRVTGERDELPSELDELVAAVKNEAPVPVAVGFGIGTASQAATVGRVADGVIIGSRLVRAVAESDDHTSAGETVAAFLRETRQALAR